MSRWSSSSETNYQRHVAERERLQREHERLVVAQIEREMMMYGLDVAGSDSSSRTVIHERNHEGKPSATHVSGKPGSVLPKELLVHLQEVKGEEREREVLKAVKAIDKKSAQTNGFIDTAAILQAQLMSMNPFSSPTGGFVPSDSILPYPL